METNVFDFSLALSSGVDTRLMDVVQTGSGMAVSQANGALVITTGVTANDETIIRSKMSWAKQLLATFFNTRSQAIINNLLSVMLTDVIGDGLTVNVTSTTAVDVVIPATSPYYKTFKDLLTVSSTGMVGMKMFLGAMASVTGAIPGQYPIASAAMTSGQITLTFTVSGFTSGSTGTCSLYGWNYIHVFHNGATATQAYFNCCRYGWPSALGDVATTIATSTTGGEHYIFKSINRILYADSTDTSLGTQTNRASRNNSIPPEDVPLFLQIVVRNGSTAPASTTTWTLNAARVEQYDEPMNVGFGVQNAPPVANTPVTVASGTITTVSAITAGNVTPTLLSTVGPSTPHTLVGAATTNATLVKNSAGTINGGIVSNTSATVVYFKMFNKASAPTVGSDTPVFNIPIPAAGNVNLNAIAGVAGYRFSTGISYAITTGSALADATAVAAAGTAIVNLNYV